MADLFKVLHVSAIQLYVGRNVWFKREVPCLNVSWDLGFITDVLLRHNTSLLLSNACNVPDPNIFSGSILRLGLYDIGINISITMVDPDADTLGTHLECTD